MTQAVTALGAMSGTSLDGVDAAILVTDGETVESFGRTAYRPYAEDERATLRRALGRWEGPEVEAAARVVEKAHAELLAGLPDATLVGFHGQTLAHDPKGRGTLQVGDGAWLAEELDRPVAWDFRSEDVRRGGEGAPLAPFYHWALARWIGARDPVAFLNLGGVGNVTWIDPARQRPEDEGALLAFDTGPANAPLDDLMLRRRGVPRDEDGALAGQGTPSPEVVERFLQHAYFARRPPKSLDRDDFPALASMVEHLSDADAAATLTACTARAVGQAMALCPRPPSRLLVTGGGRRNATMMAMIAQAAGCPVEPVEAAGLDGDMLEAQAFAFLAVRVERGLPTSAAGTTGVPAPTCGGTLSRPENNQAGRRRILLP